MIVRSLLQMSLREIVTAFGAQLFLTRLQWESRDPGEALLIPRFPILQIFFGLLQHGLIFGFYFITVGFNILHDLRHLVVSEIELVADSVGGPASMEIIQKAIQGNPGASNREPAAGSDHRRL
jgi:hypothetical protein